MPMLKGVLALHDVKDVERFCRRAIQIEMRWQRMHGLSETDYEEALAYVIAECWILGERYDPTRSPSFSTYAFSKCRLRFVNWQHTKLGRNRDREQPVSLEGWLEGGRPRDNDTGDSFPSAAPAEDYGTRTHVLIDPRTDDPAGRGGADLLWLLGERLGASADAIDALDQSQTPRAA